LIELLAVMAVVAVLVALLFPVLSTMRENANRAKCMSNLKQIGVGVTMYTQEHDYWLPSSSNGQASLWTEAVAPYILGNDFTANEDVSNPAVLEKRRSIMSVFLCPSTAHGDLRTRSEGSAGNYGPTNYAYCNRCGMQLTGDYGGVNLLRVSKPSAAVLIADAGVRSWMPTCAEFYDQHEMGTLHRGGANLLYLDGHVGWTVPSTFPIVDPDDYYWRWGQGSGT